MTDDGQRLRVTIGDDRESRRAELRWALQAAGAVVVGEAVTGAELVRMSLHHQPDLVVMAPDIADGSPADTVAHLLAAIPGAQIICDDPTARPPRSAERLHLVRGLVPGHVVLTMRCLTFDRLPRKGTAVVCVSDPGFRMAVVAALGDEGLGTVEEVLGAAAACRAVDDHLPDILVMDLSLTGMGGWLYLKELSRQHPDCRIVVTSPLGAVPLAVLEVGVSGVVADGDIAGLRLALQAALRDRQAPLSLVTELEPMAGSRMVNPPLS